MAMYFVCCILHANNPFRPLTPFLGGEANLLDKSRQLLYEIEAADSPNECFTA